MGKNLLLGTVSALLVAVLTWFVWPAGPAQPAFLPLPPRAQAEPTQQPVLHKDAGQNDSAIQVADAGQADRAANTDATKSLDSSPATEPELEALPAPVHKKSTQRKSKKRVVKKKKAKKKKATHKKRKKKSRKKPHKKRPKKKPAKIKAKVRWGS